MIIITLTLSLLSGHVGAARFSAILKGSAHVNAKAGTADPYGWELQSNPVSRHSCYSLDEATLPKLISIRDSSCVGSAEPNGKCRGGFPFYRFSGGPADCLDCLDASRCQMMCLSKGMDAAALVMNGETHVPAECRCGATKKNLSVWGLLKTATDDNQIHFGPVHGLLPPTPMSAVASDDPRCAMYVYLYTDQREEDGGVPSQFIETTTADDFYIRSIVSGMADPGDVEDSTVADGERVHAAIANRLALWRRANPTGKIPRDEIFVEQVAESAHVQAPGCANVDEPSTCFDSAVDSVLATNGWKRQNSDGSYTTEYSTMMMTVPFKTWQQMFTSSSNVGSYRSSAFCSSTGNAKACPITCGACELFDRPPARASMYESWFTTNQDTNTGIVTIPVVFDNSNALLTQSLKDMVTTATQIWASVTCVKFDIQTSPPRNQRYVLVTVKTDASGHPSGCLADPVGMPDSPSTPTSINVGGCLENKKPLGSVIHEFAHVLGLVHTQMRPDRDDYISMNPAMVKDPFQANFYLAPYAFDGASGSYSPYDYGSIMHYTRTQAADAAKYVANSVDWSGTFKLTKPAAAGVTIGQRDQLSVLDIAEVNSIYQCGNVLANQPPAVVTTGSPYLVPAPTNAPTTAPPTNAPPTAGPNVGGAGLAPSIAPATTTSAPGTTTPAPPAWTGWDDDVQTIASSIDSVLKSTNINLSMKQLDLINAILDQERALYTTFNNALETQAVPKDWRAGVTGIASNVLQIIAEARVGIKEYIDGVNEAQEGILDTASIANLKLLIATTKTVYAKFDAYINTLSGRVSMHDSAQVVFDSPNQANAPEAAHRPAPKTVVVFQ